MSSASKDRRINELFTKGAITETFQSSLEIKTCFTIKIQPKHEIVIT